MSNYQYRHDPYQRPPELDGKGHRRPVVIVGAGMAGPTLALELALRGAPAATRSRGRWRRWRRPRSRNGRSPP